nr:hypothetical protein [Corynebacterium bovis]
MRCTRAVATSSRPTAIPARKKGIHVMTGNSPSISRQRRNVTQSPSRTISQDGV